MIRSPIYLFTYIYYKMDTTTSRWGMWTWLIILILFLFFANWSWFGSGSAVPFIAWAASQWPSAAELLMNNNTSWQQHVDNLQSNCNQTNTIMTWLNNLNNTVLQWFMWLQPNFCEINKNIDRSIYEAQKNTCEIITNQNANTQKVLDLINNNTITTLNRDLQSAQLTLANANQSQYLISQLKTS